MMSSYHVSPNQSGHRFTINIHTQIKPQQINEFYLPVWIAGSYCRRDFAKFISNLTAYDADGNIVEMRQISPSSWRVNTDIGGDLLIQYQIYSRDISVRGNYLDHERAIFNPAAACLILKGAEKEPCSLQFTLSGKHENWSLVGGDIDGTQFNFEDYYEMIDTPFMMAKQLQQFSFVVNEIPHYFWISGDASEYDLERLCKDAKAGCQAAFDIFDEFPTAIRERYVFMLHLTENIHGGLEHRRSTMLMQKRNAMNSEASYRDLISLIVHEYFHLWNVKDLIPAVYQPYNLTAEQPNDLLWLFEGYTAYFDNWLCQKAGIFTAQEYLDVITTDINNMNNRRGRFVQTLVQSSIEAWTKLYNGGEDASNIAISYYVQGSLAALCMDLWLRKNTDLVSLPYLIRMLWTNFRNSGKGLTEERFREQATYILPFELHEPFNHLLTHLIRTTDALPLQEFLTWFGVDTLTYNEHSADAGFNFKNGVVSLLDDDSDAALVGVAVGDVIISVDYLPATETNLTARLLKQRAGKSCQISVNRDGKIYDFEFILSAPKEQVSLSIVNYDLLHNWLS